MLRTLLLVVAMPGVAYGQTVVEHEYEPAGGHGRDGLGIPASRLASGTSWIADASPVRAVDVPLGGWHVALHGTIFAGYIDQRTEAGDAELVSQNWAMVTATHELGGGELALRGMASLEPLTVGERYPLLLQTGETADGMPLVDGQHPNDLIMELTARYQRPIGRGLAFELYGGPVGEPALGPPTFLQRPSSFANPLAPLGHHMQDSTHIAYGVVTAGLYTRDAKLEASWFNGREPDEDRWDLDLRFPDSYAARASFVPAPAWSLSAAYGYLESPVEREAYVSIQRFTYSLTHARRLGGRRTWTTTAVVGQNFPSEGSMTHSELIETALDLDRGGTTFARFEEMGKSGRDFALAPESADADVLFGTLVVGHVHPVARTPELEASIGVLGSLAYVDDILVPRYRTHWPFGAMLHVQVLPRATAVR